MQRWSTGDATTNSAKNLIKNSSNQSGQFVLQGGESYSFHGAATASTGAVLGASVRPSTAVPLPTMFSVRFF